MSTVKTGRGEGSRGDGAGHWGRFRMLEPGEIDACIARDRLDTVPFPEWDAPTRRACASIFQRFVEAGNGAPIPGAAFCTPGVDVPRWTFLEYVTWSCGVVLVGSDAPGLTGLEPRVVARNVRGWHVPRLHGFTDATRAIHHAVLDRDRLRRLGHPLRVTVPDRFRDGRGRERHRFYFGLDYRALPYAPWRRGTVYLYARADLPDGFDSPRLPPTPHADAPPIRPLASLMVDPWDWPLLDRVHGMDAEALHGRERETYAGYPWPDDDAIHPWRGRRAIADEARSYLDRHLHHNVTLDELGRRAGVSAFTLLRVFRAAQGCSPHEYQTLARVERARRLLRSGTSIARTAAEVGLCDQAHLTRVFRRIVGMTPGKYLRVQESSIPPV